nr:tetraspanin [Hymenolepis microstoma]
MKFILFSLNLLFVLIGLALVVGGAWAVFNIPSFMQALAFAFDAEVSGSELYQNDKLTQAVAYLSIGLGIFIFLVAFFGCCGVVTDSCCLLITYAVVVSLLFLTKVICILVFLLLGEKISPMVFDRVQESFSANYKGYLGLGIQDESMSYSQAADTIMLNFICCGVYGADDFKSAKTSKLWHEEGRVYQLPDGQNMTGDEVGLPVACCQFKDINFPMNATFQELHRHMKSPQCPVNPISNYFAVGCVDRISNNLKHYTVVIAVAPVIIAVIEVIGVILASALAHEVKQDVERLYY